MTDAAERFAAALRSAEDRLRAAGLGGRRAFVALVRHLAGRLDLPRTLWPDGADAPAAARLNEIPLAPDLDLFGLAYERFFTDLFKGERGQYFTPRPLVELMADLAAVRSGDRVLDPTCGSGGFLIAALARGADVDGIEVDPDLAALARLNLALHGANPRGIRAEDTFRAVAEPVYDVVLANPPFSVVVDHPEALAGATLAEGKGRVGSDTLFVEAALRWLRPGGRLVTVLPYGVLANPSSAPLRAFIEAVAVREAIVSLPEGVFRPFGGTPTRACVIALRKRPTLARPMLAAVIRAPGFDPRRKRYRRTEPDELTALRLHLKGMRGEGLFSAPFDGAREVDAVWVPEEAFVDRAKGAPTFRVGDVARVRPARRVGREERTTVIEFADVDKATGEVTGRRTRRGGDGVLLEDGDVLFGRMRPELVNVTRARPPADGMPEVQQGSGEWIALETETTPEFLVLALRSTFARAQLPVTQGQTRPRIHAADVVALELPDPGPELRARLDAVLTATLAERRHLRDRLDAVAAAYERFGRGELDVATFATWVDALTTSPGSGSGGEPAGDPSARPPR